MKTKPSVQFIAALSAAMFMAAGCSSTVENDAPSTQTQVNLNHANYKVLKAGAEGRSYGFRFLLGIIPITAPSTAEAREDLYHNVNQPVNGKSIALINVTEDRSTTWLILFSIPKIVVTGDVVEFNDDAAATPIPPATPQ
jgi:hypothetical protein